MSSRLAVVALLGVVSACQCGGGAPPGAKYRFTSEGEGPTNAAPLNPLRVGSVLGEGVDTTIIDGVIETPSGRELRMTRVFSNLVTRVTQAPDGLFFTGSTADGTAPTPLLVVPATVRVGMKWEVFSEAEAPLYRYEVVERTEVADSWFGPSVAWRIDQTDDQGAVVSRQYLEGRGSTATPPRVMLNEEPQVSPERAPAVELEPLVVPASFGKRGWVESLSLVRVGEGPGLFLANDEAYENGGQLGWCGAWSGALEAPVTAVAPSMGSPFRRTLGPECVSTQYCSRVTTSTGAYLDCNLEYVSGHASGMMVGSDGKLTWAPRTNAGTLAYADLVRAGRDYSETSYRAFAVVPDAQGRGNVLYTHYAGYQDLLALGDEVSLLGDGSQPRLVPNNTLALHDLSFISPLSEDTGGRSTLLLQTGDGMLWSATLSGMTLSRPRRHVRLAGRLAVQATERGHEVLRVTADGLVQRLRVDAEGLGLDPVAQVTVAAGEAVVGAFLWREAGGTRLVVATTVSDERDARGPTVRLTLHRSKAQVTPGPTERPSAVNGVRAVTGGANQDVLVCWSGGGEPTLTGWTIGGEPAAAVAALDFAGPCVQVFRPAGQANGGGGVLGSRYWTVEGPVPGLGRVTVRMGVFDPDLGLKPNALPTVLAPLQGGGFVSARRIYGAGGVTLGVPTALLDGEPAVAGCLLGGPCSAFADAAGNGLWANWLHPTRTDISYVRRLGLSSFSMEVPRGSGVELPAGGGGAIVGLVDAGVVSRYLMDPDGGVTPLPDLPVEYGILGLTADGSLCGFVRGATRTFCRRAGAAEVTQPLPSGSSDLWPMRPTNEGVLIGLAPGSLDTHYGLDPATGAVFDHPPPHLDPLLYTYASDGSLWGLVLDTTPGLVAPVKAVRFKRSGPVEVPIPAGLVPPGDRLVRMEVDEQVILFVTQFQRMFTLARPE